MKTYNSVKLAFVIILQILITITSCKKETEIPIISAPATSLLPTSASYIGSYNLSVGRYLLGAAATGTKVVFAGGISKNVKTGLWTVSELSEARQYCVASAAGNIVLFAGIITRIKNVFKNLKTIAPVKYALFNLLTSRLINSSHAFAG